jgi:PhnB protein
MTVEAIPNPHQPMCPYLIVRGASSAIEFYATAFGAREMYRLTDPDGKIGHAELDVLGGRVMLADEFPDFGATGPLTIGGTPVSIHVYVMDVDELVARAEDAGATLLQAPKDEFFGHRVALLTDPFGHRWHLACRKEDVSPEEMQTRMNAAYA